MNGETEQFLRQVRDAEAPSSADEERVLAALRRSIAAGVALTVAGTVTHSAGSSGATGVGSAASSSAAFTAIGAKVSLVVLCASGVFGTGDSPQSDRAPVTLDSTVTAVGSANRPTSGAPAGEVRIAETPVVPEATVTDSGALTASGRLASVPPNASRSNLAHAEQSPRRPSRDRSEPEAPAPEVERRTAVGETQRTTLREEIAHLRRVQAALRQGDGVRALQLLDAHSTGDRQFAAERSAARILALCASGRVAEARRAAQVFVRRFPNSVQRSAIARSCANSKRN